ncbi:hypothetical protein GC197_13645 [bacterium]|nr:hypothetical protein [bacterium]
MSTIPQPNDLANSYAATYDAWNRLVKLEDGSNTVAEYEYDGAKRRTIVKSYVSGSLDETRHAYFTDPAKWQVIEERIDSSSDPQSQHVWGLRYIDDLILRDRDTTGNGTLDARLYSLQDANWNVTALADTSGDVQERFAYQPYGASEKLDPGFTAYSGSDLEWTVRFTGRELDLATGLQINRNRYLHLQLGCWITRDPIGYQGSQWNLYLPLASSPLITTDPNGLAYIRTDGPSGGTYCDITPQECPQLYSVDPMKTLEERISWYGCHCGGDNYETSDHPRRPIDEIDEGCSRHDKCYDSVQPPCKGARQVWVKTESFPYRRLEFEYDPRPECEKCDRKFCESLKKADCSGWSEESERQNCRIFKGLAMTAFSCQKRFNIR